MPPVVTFVGLGSGISLTSVVMAPGVPLDPRGPVRDKNETGNWMSTSE